MTGEFPQGHRERIIKRKFDLMVATHSVCYITCEVREKSSSICTNPWLLKSPPRSEISGKEPSSISANIFPP